ncbi:MAG: monovalent cation/H(+) antiporter subunit G [Chloroflexi bacterium]|nr:monovalent cation/H(+) antiporter subunit G [Chloroflexota bacterium]
MIQTVISAILLTLGALLMLLAGIGILRLPDVFLRMSATSKAATLGVILIMVATAVYFNDLGVTARAMGIVIFIILTVPVSAHMIGRAAYITGVPLWPETRIDELKGRYDEETHRLEGQPAESTNVNQPG